MQAVIDRAEPMVRLLWQRETEGKSVDSPERRAALDKSLRAAIARIADPSIRTHYGEAIRALRAELYGAGARRGWRGPFKGEAARAVATPSARASLLAMGGGAVEDHLRRGRHPGRSDLQPVCRGRFRGGTGTDGLRGAGARGRAARGVAMPGQMNCGRLWRQRSGPIPLKCCCPSAI